MEEKHYMISDAAKMVDVESHVLRYWEEELKIDIPRNEMGHRYYTDTYIHLFKEIKNLKEQGFLLKAIKTLMPGLMEGKSFSKETTTTGGRRQQNIGNHRGRKCSGRAGKGKNCRPEGT